MPRPSEIATDARALYGPPSVRPAAGDMGDGALWVDPGDNQALWQVQSGNWRQIALPPADVDTDDDSSVPAGVPVLRGPYVVDFSDLLHDGDTVTLWTPAVGDVLLRLFHDWQAATNWDLSVTPGSQALLSFGQAPDGSVTPPHSVFAQAVAGSLGPIDMVYNDVQYDAAGTGFQSTGFIFHTTTPVSVRLDGAGVTAPTQGRLALYVLVARAVAP